MQIYFHSCLCSYLSRVPILVEGTVSDRHQFVAVITSNFLLLNSEKTEVLIIGPKIPTSNNLEHCLTLDGCSVDSSSSVRNLGVLFDNNLSFDSHVSSICKTAFFHLKNISKLISLSPSSP